MRQVQIRSVRQTDAEAINVLLGQLGYPQEDGVATAARIQVWADNPFAAVYVADGPDGVVGVVAVLVCPFFEHEGNWGRIAALVVADCARGQGIGSGLVAAAEAFAWKHGCQRMEVTTSDRREPQYAAHRFYQGCGYGDQTGVSTLFRK